KPRLGQRVHPPAALHVEEPVPRGFRQLAAVLRRSRREVRPPSARRAVRAPGVREDRLHRRRGRPFRLCARRERQDLRVLVRLQRLPCRRVRDLPAPGQHAERDHHARMKRDTLIFTACGFLLGLTLGSFVIGPKIAHSKLAGAPIAETTPETPPPSATAASPMAGVMQQLTTLKAAIAKNPNDADALAQLGDMYMQAAK